MTIFWAAVTIATALVMGGMLWILKRHSGQAEAERLDFDMAVFKDQLAELEQDLKRGVVIETEAKAAREEIERRILAAADRAEGKSAAGRTRGFGESLAGIGSIVVFVPVITFGLYFYLGSPGYRDIPFVKRDIAAEKARIKRLEEAQEMAGLVGKLEERLKTDTGNVRGWLLLGRTYLTMERGKDALAALRKARELAPEDPAVATELAEALVITDENRVGMEAQEIFQDVLSRDARSPRARYYLALGNAQRGKLKEALQGWVDLMAVSRPDAPWRGTVSRSIQRAAEDLKIDPASVKPTLSAKLLGPGKPAEAPPLPGTTAPADGTPGPSREDVAAAQQMSEGDRQEMIRGMVQRLADRLKDNPDDLAGWQRLARAYKVLGENEKAREAEARVEALQ